MPIPVEPHIAPMLAQIDEDLPANSDALFELKSDDFRAIVFRGDDSQRLAVR
jgi:ATP-dependent DNA ligase